MWLPLFAQHISAKYVISMLSSDKNTNNRKVSPQIIGKQNFKECFFDVDLEDKAHYEVPRLDLHCLLSSCFIFDISIPNKNCSRPYFNF